ncbi:MAG: zf-HC2 domain-containing protein [Candidatus Omnitrophota bacterium]
MDCLKFHEHLYAFLDGEIDDSLKTEMAQHAGSCPVCSLELDHERNFGTLLKSHMIKESAPYALKESLIEQLEKKKNQFSWKDVFQVRAAWGIALVIVILVGTVSLRISGVKPFPVFAEVTSKHLEYLRGVYPLEFKTGEWKEALDWFGGKTDFAVTAPHIALNKVNVIGGRMINLKDKKSAYILMEKDGYKISCFYTDLKDVKIPAVSVKEGITTPDGHLLVKSERGYNTVFCYHKADGTACIFVTDMPMDQFSKLFV